jgi:hypothetical protein
MTLKIHGSVNLTKDYIKENIVTSSLILNLDAGKVASYPGSGQDWYDYSGTGNHFTVDSGTVTYNSQGYFNLFDGGFYKKTSAMSGITTTSSTCVTWIKTTDPQGVFWGSPNVAIWRYYLGAYSSSNKYYNYNAWVGYPTCHIDTVQTDNLYDYILDGKWHMVEFKGVNFFTVPWTGYWSFGRYPSFTFNDTTVSCLSIYNKSLSYSESVQNFNALRYRYGI